ncbi:MAG TPA: DMT family transporter [Roseiflexaceae bacterium]|nr:DMT family transporter [Roseiflexaceae bacterium]
MQRSIIARPHAETAGLWYGLLGVLGFSLTLPATRVAVAYLDPSVVGLGRALVAAVLAALLLAITRQRRPTRAELGSLAIVAGGVILGFPFLSAWALRQVPAAHGAIVIGLLPLATALVAAVRVGERPSWQFWLASLAGSAAVIGFAIATGADGLHAADLALLAAVAAGAVGYAEGGRLARTLGGWQVICWALLLAAPFVSIPVGVALWRHGADAPLSAWLAFVYVAVISQLLAFFAWYRGLALGGVARVSQIQLLQPFLTLLASALLLHEQITPAMLLIALLVLLSVALGRRAAVARPSVKAVYNKN